MELHFCSQCGISIPLTEVQSGAAAAGDGRHLCAEHRPGAKTAAPAAPAAKEEFELLFCANCKVSIPVGDVESGLAKREFGSLLCGTCTAADSSTRDRRRKAVELELADEEPPKLSDTAESRRCRVCSAIVPQAQIASGRALVDGDRVVCPRCRDAGATAAPPAMHAAPRSSSSSAGTIVMVVLVAVAFGAAGFFGAEYVKMRNAPAGPETASASDVTALRTDVQSRLDKIDDALRASAAAPGGVQKEAVDAVQARLDDSVLAVREDLADVRSRLGAKDDDLSQRLARLEGQVAGLQEMIKGLAARPSGEMPRPPAAGGDGTVPPEGPPPEGPKVQVPPGPQVQQPSAEVTKLVKDLLESKEEGVRFAAAYELIRRKEKSAIPAFAKVLADDPNVMVRRAGASGLGELKAWNGVPVLIQALEDKEAYVAQKANFALQAITGQDFGVTIDHSLRDRKTKAAAAQKWWEKNKDSPPDGVCLEPITLPK